MDKLDINIPSMGFILFCVFLILKVTKVWCISWFWVFFPLWIAPVTLITIYLILFIIALILDR